MVLSQYSPLQGHSALGSLGEPGRSSCPPNPATTRLMLVKQAELRLAGQGD